MPTTVKKTDTAELACPTANEDARRYYNEASQLHQQGKLREAEESYLKAIEKDPKYCDAMDNLGQMLRSQGKTDQAISWYTRSLSVKPDNVVAHQNLAAAFIVRGDTDKALAEYRWLIQHDPKNPEGYYGLGNTLLTTGKAAEAVGPLANAEKLYRDAASPLLTDAQYELGLAYYLLKEYRKTRDYLLLVYAERKDDPNVNYLLGLCYLEPPIEDRAKAREYLKKAESLGEKVPADVMQEPGN